MSIEKTFPPANAGTFSNPEAPPARKLTRFAWIVLTAWLAVLLSVCVRVALSPHRQSLFDSDYAPAGWHWLHGTEIYSFRQHFLYSPPTAAFFAPFALLPAAVGGVLWRLACAGALFLAALAWLRSSLPALGHPAAGRETLPLPSLALLLFLPLAVGNVNNGQMNLAILALSLGSVLAVRHERWALAATLLAGIAFVKIYPLALGLLLTLLYPRQLSWRLALALLLLFIVSFGLQRPGYVWAEYHQWFGVLGRDNRLDGDAARAWRDFGFLLRESGLPVSDRAYRVTEAAAGAALALFLWWGQLRRDWPREKLLGGVLCLGCAWMVLFGPATEAATYVIVAFPLSAALAAAWLLPSSAGERFVPSMRVLLTAVYALLLVAESFNSWIPRRALPLYTRALQPAGALLFAGAVVWWLLRRAPAGRENLPASLIAPRVGP